MDPLTPLLLLAPPLLDFSMGLRADAAALPAFHLQADLRHYPDQGALYLGGGLSWGAQIDDRDPERVTADQRAELAALAGGRLDLGTRLFLLGGARAGLTASPDLDAGWFAGLEAGFGVMILRAWGHPLHVELRGGARQRDQGRELQAGLYLTGALLPEPPAR